MSIQHNMYMQKSKLTSQTHGISMQSALECKSPVRPQLTNSAQAPYSPRRENQMTPPLCSLMVSQRKLLSVPISKRSAKPCVCLLCSSSSTTDSEALLLRSCAADIKAVILLRMPSTGPTSSTPGHSASKVAAARYRLFEVVVLGSAEVVFQSSVIRLFVSARYPAH
jgi:hypothetical protein